MTWQGTLEPAAVVWIAAGEFRMGADPVDMDFAGTLCRRDLVRFAAQRQHDAGDPLVAMEFRLQLHLCSGQRAPGAPCDPERFSWEAVSHPVWLTRYGIDRTEVTVAAYDACVQSGACRAPLDPPGTPYYGLADHPVVGVSWDDARAYCAWRGGRLPTEAEWERAARGPDGRPFPWGWQYDPRRLNHGQVETSCHDDRDGAYFTAPVGSYPGGASPYGALDMAGNVREWTADRVEPSLFGYPMSRQVMPAGSPAGSERAVRGGAFNQPPWMSRTTARERELPSARERNLGLRCAYDG